MKINYQNSQGVSLLELIVLLAILGGLSVFINQGLNGSLHKNQLKKVALQIEDEIYLTGELAKELGETTSLEFSQSGARAVITRRSKVEKNIKNLPNSLKLESANFGVFKNTANFFEGGTSSPGSIIISEKEGGAYCKISISIAGRVKQIYGQIN